MSLRIISCDYSYHRMPFTMGERRPLSSYIFRLQTEGSSRLFVDGQMKHVGVGDLQLFAPGDLYELVMDESDDGKVVSGDYYLICEGDWVDEWWQRRVRPQCVNIGLDEPLMALWMQIILEKRRVGERNSELLGYLLQAICCYMDRALEAAESTVRGSYAAYRMKRYIEEHASVSFKVEDVARQVGLSSSRAAHLFKEAFGESIMQYAVKVRLAMAVERMKYSSLPLEQVAESCGMGSYPYFHRIFKERYGQSPSEFRKAWLEKAEQWARSVPIS